jgi:hypothetical protein
MFFEKFPCSSHIAFSKNDRVITHS